MPKILVTFKGKVLQEVLLAEGTTRIGRDPTNDIRLDNTAVSRFHAEIYRQGWPWFIEDLKSTNGTLVNGQPLAWKQGLNPDDQITIGKHTLIFRAEKRDYEGRDQTTPVDVEATICITPKKR